MRVREDSAQAVEGVSKVYHICPNVSPHEVEMGKLIIAAARVAAVDHFVYHSVLHPQTQKMPHHWNKLLVEELLLESNLPFTILQPTIYMQNILGGWEAIVTKGIYAVPYSVESELSKVDLEDVAEVAAQVLTEPGHRGATYELCGVDRISSEEVAQILSEKLGHEIQAVKKSIDEWVQEAKASGLKGYRLETLVKMFEYYNAYGFPGNKLTLHSLLDRPPTDFGGFVEKVIQQEGYQT
jgi:uncharacterized protein YbjT (DUF2867 family)